MGVLLRHQRPDGDPSVTTADPHWTAHRSGSSAASAGGTRPLTIASASSRPVVGPSCAEVGT